MNQIALEANVIARNRTPGSAAHDLEHHRHSLAALLGFDTPGEPSRDANPTSHPLIGNHRTSSPCTTPSRCRQNRKATTMRHNAPHLMGYQRNLPALVATRVHKTTTTATTPLQQGK